MKRMISATCIAFVTLLSQPVTADTCDPHWDNNIGQPGLNHIVNALAIFDDGPGPAIYAAGQFTTAGGAAAHRVAKWDGTEWSPLGSGMNGRVNDLAVFDDGTGPALYAGGQFTTAGGTSANRIAKWNGTAWSPLARGLGGNVFNDAVYALAVYDDGSGTGPALYAGGQFTNAGFDTVVNRIAKWLPEAPAWVPVGDNGLSSTVRSLAVFDDGSGPALYAGGEFTTTIELGDGEGGCYGFCGQQTPEGCYCGLGCCGLGDCCENFCEACGDCDVAAQCTNGLNVNYIAKWNGAKWSALDGGVALDPWTTSVNALTVYNGELIVGGNFVSVGTTRTVAASHVARWDGTSWSPLDLGVNDTVHALAMLESSGSAVLFAGGAFSTAGGTPANNIARWNSTSWSQLTSGVNSTVNDLATVDLNDSPSLIVAGNFTTAGGAPANRIALWHDCLDVPGCDPADINGDGVVNVADMLILLANWGPCPLDNNACPADLNDDGIIDVADLLILLANWG